jgi:crotonobetainyl-CoA:carnitine CoA-transferase CaiB-like acyl-CoA transferase
VLDGVRVLDLTSYLPGPYASMLLADLGADVISVEPPGGEAGRTTMPRVDDDSALHAWVGRNKRSWALDLKAPDQHRLCLDLIAGCDVVLEGFTPGVAERLGLAYEDCRLVNPSVVYCAISGLGHEYDTGTPGHDINLLARSGFLDQTGDRLNDGAGAPALIGSPIADLSAGLHAAVGVLAALRRRDVGGGGAYLDVAMLSVAVALAGPQLVKATAPDPTPRAKDPNLGADPGYNTYRTADGRWIALGGLEAKFWERLCRRINRDDLIGLRSEQPEKVIAELEVVFAECDQAHWNHLLDDAAVCYSPVVRIEDVPGEQHVWARRDVVEVGGLRQPESPIRFPLESGHPHRPAAPVGTDELSWQLRPNE